MSWSKLRTAELPQGRRTVSSLAASRNRVDIKARAVTSRSERIASIRLRPAPAAARPTVPSCRRAAAPRTGRPIGQSTFRVRIVRARSLAQVGDDLPLGSRLGLHQRFGRLLGIQQPRTRPVAPRRTALPGRRPGLRWAVP